MSLLKSEVISLFRSLLRASKKFTDYNFRSYAIRRTKQGFYENKFLIENEKIINEYKFGLEQLKIVERQATISGLFPETPSVMRN